VAETEFGAHQLRRVLTVWDLVALGIGGIIGVGIFILPGIEAAKHAGPGIMLSFAIAAVACSCAALCYAELAAMIPVAGSACTYGYATLGELPAWIIGWDLILEYTVAAASALLPMRVVAELCSIGTLFAFLHCVRRGHSAAVCTSRPRPAL
jgi:APA family basic amino acid/polyamine antiporter